MKQDVKEPENFPPLLKSPPISIPTVTSPEIFYVLSEELCGKLLHLSKFCNSGNA